MNKTLKNQALSLDENPFLLPLKLIRDGVKSSISNIYDWSKSKVKNFASEVTDSAKDALFSISKITAKAVLNLIRFPISINSNKLPKP